MSFSLLRVVSYETFLTDVMQQASPLELFTVYDDFSSKTFKHINCTIIMDLVRIFVRLTVQYLYYFTS